MVTSIWGENMLGYLSLDIICSSKLTVFLELRSWKTVCFSEQIMSSDKYPCIFSCQMEAIVYISRFVLAIYCRYISETSHGLANVKMINQRDIGTIFVISRRDNVLARLRCNDILQSKTINCHNIIFAAKFVVTISGSELRFNDLLNEAIAYVESVSVYVMVTVE